MPSNHDKTKVAPPATNQKIADLLALAAGAPPLTFLQDKSLSRLYELVVLEWLLRSYVNAGGNRKVKVKNAPGGVLYLAGSPCKADKSVFSYFSLKRNGNVEHEAWVSVEVTTLSWTRAGMQLPLPSSGKHEIDVGLFRVLSKSPHYPDYRTLHAGFSCKHRAPSKESVREVLGLRRETALLSSISRSAVPWIEPFVPAEPPSPIFLACSSPGILAYATPLEAIGVYMAHVPFPP